jgi:DNA invertase Pin-like site-specific DNA recombinase
MPPVVLHRRPEMDQLGRSLRHSIDTVMRWASGGSGAGRCGVGGHDYRGWRLLFHRFGALAQFEREIIRDRTMAAVGVLARAATVAALKAEPRPGAGRRRLYEPTPPQD